MEHEGAGLRAIEAEAITGLWGFSVDPRGTSHWLDGPSAVELSRLWVETHQAAERSSGYVAAAEALGPASRALGPAQPGARAKASPARREDSSGPVLGPAVGQIGGTPAPGTAAARAPQLFEGEAARVGLSSQQLQELL
eukprot:3492725-Lingulodinium_polyedra.AAC.1